MTGTLDDVRRLHPRLPLCGLHVTEIPRYCLWAGVDHENMVTIIITPSSVIKILSFPSFQPTEVFVQVMEGEGWGPKTPSENKTSVKVGKVEMVKMVNIITLTIFFI